ncbi:hypothetical protein C0J52_13480 [Blattella germanica]|nr:hypothetical protein C0J52_13480 [Blattella germanica]
MLKHQNGNLFNVDTFFSRVYGKNIREAIFDTYPELISELPRPLQESTDSPEIAIYVLACLQKVKRGNIEGLKELLKSEDINVNIKNAYGNTPLHYLCDIHPSNKTESDLIQQAMQLIVDVSEPKDGEVLNLRLKADLNVTNKDGETPLHVAARMGEKETIFILLRNGANLMKKTANFEPPICSINPSVLESYLDECIEINDYSPLHNDFMLSFDYSFLEHLMEGKTEGKTNKKQNHDPDMVMINSYQKLGLVSFSWHGVILFP